MQGQAGEEPGRCHSNVTLVSDGAQLRTLVRRSDAAQELVLKLLHERIMGCAPRQAVTSRRSSQRQWLQRSMVGVQSAMLGRNA
jgi:hypothetical protein